MSSKKPSNEIHLSRTYDAPVKTVWEAWTDPKKVAQWWGPRGFTLTHHSKDLKPGGTWKYTMHGPDGVDYPNITVYHEVEQYRRLVYDHGANEKQPPLFRVTVTFTEIHQKTQMEMTMAFKDAETAEQMGQFIKKAGGNATWDRLAEFLDFEISGKNRFVINRSFETPLAKMFEMWTNPKLFSQWLAPTGFRMEFIRAELKSGGSTFYMMTNDSDIQMYGRAQYIEITSPHRLVYTQQFCDKNENVSRHPLSPTWPETMLTNVTFTAEGSDQTRVTVTWEPFGKCSPEELDTFLNGRAGMTLGWTGSFDKLEQFLKEN